VKCDGGLKRYDGMSKVICEICEGEAAELSRNHTSMGTRVAGHSGKLSLKLYGKGGRVLEGCWGPSLGSCRLFCVLSSEAWLRELRVGR